jgi:hypothetical protein
MTQAIRLMLQACLFLPLFLCLSFGHSYLALWTSGLCSFFHSSVLQHIAMFVSAVVPGLLITLLLAYPFLALYGRMAVIVSSVTSLLAAMWRFALLGPAHHAIVLYASVLGIVCLAIFPPVGVWLASRLRPNYLFQRTLIRYAASRR